MSQKSKYKFVALSEPNYLLLKEFGSAGDTFDEALSAVFEKAGVAKKEEARGKKV